LLNSAREVVGVRRAGGIGIALLRQAIQGVVDVLNRLTFAVGFAREIPDGVIRVGFVEARRERGLSDAAKGIVGEICCVAVRVGDAQQIVFRVVAIGGDVTRRVGDRG